MATKQKSNKTLFLLIGAIVVLILALLILKKNGVIGSDNAIKVELAEVKETKVVEQVSASGDIQPELEIKVSPEVSGEIIQLDVEEGDSVVAGQMLVKIRPDNFQNALQRAYASLNQQRANLAQARAAQARASASLEQAELTYKRQEELRKDNVISQADFETASVNYAVAREDYNSAKQSVIAAQYLVRSTQANVADAQENLKLTTISAPMTGVLSKLNVERGERVLGTSQMQGTELFRIADLGSMEVRVDVNENDIIKINIGDPVIIDVDSYSYMDKSFKGVVSQIANTANDKVSPDAVTEFEVKIRILNDSYRDLTLERGIRFPFRPGMTASVDIVTMEKPDIITVPLSAVTTRSSKDLERARNGGSSGPERKKDGGLPADGKEKDDLKEVVFVNVNGIAEIREVTTGINDFDNIEILSGVSKGEEVVSGPFLVVSKRLKNGDKISRADNPEDFDQQGDDGDD